MSQHPCTTVKSALRQTQYTGFTAEKQDCSLDVCKGQWIAAAIPAFACVFLFRGIPDHWRLKAQKGRDDVNVFRNRDMLLGVGEAAAFSAAQEEFLSLAAKLRRELGDRQYQLDRYLVILFEMRSDYAAQDALDAGAEVFFQLHTHSRKAILQEGEGTSREFINAHPCRFKRKPPKRRCTRHGFLGSI